MSCGKKPFVKNWDHPRYIRVITPSRYEQNEASVKKHWRNVVRDLEMSYKDEKFWESATEQVGELVGPIIFKRLVKIFDLPVDVEPYEPKSDLTSMVPSEEFYHSRTEGAPDSGQPTFSMSDFVPSVEEEEEALEEEIESWTDESDYKSTEDKLRSRSQMQSKSLMSKSVLKPSSKSIRSKLFSKSNVSRAMSSRSRGLKSEITTTDVSAHTDDDVQVHPGGLKKMAHRRKKNPHFEMLYCNESETDMIKWNSNYKKKAFEVSASDEFSKKAEILTKQIASDFYDWWVGLGNVEFKSEIKRPEDIEDLFQVWFDEHASRGIVLHPKILPCVLQTIADFIDEAKLSCPNVLKRQIAYDIHAEISPAHTKAFGSCLPQKMKHIPPNNSTKELWHCVKIPEDLRSMSCVWGEISHLTSTKAFQSWLQQRPHLPMPPCLKPADDQADQKQLFVVPSDFVVRTGSAGSSTHDLALPVSQFSLELKEVLSKLMNQ